MLEHVHHAIRFVLQFGIEVLTDPDDPEAKPIPDPILLMGKRHERRPDAEHSNECCRLVRAVLSYAQCEDGYLEHAPPLVCPVVCRQQLTFLTRYVRSYLMPDADEYVDFCTTYATSFQEGHELVEQCLGKVVRCLRVFSSEPSVVKHAALLARALVTNRRAQRALPASPNWRLFAGAVQKDEFPGLPGEFRRELFEVVCIGAGPGSIEVLLRPLQQRFQGLMQQPGFAERCQQETVRQEMECCLEQLRGVSRAGLSGRAQAQTFLRFATEAQLLASLVQLMDLCHMHHSVVILIIRCFDDLVLSHSMFDSEEGAPVLCDKCLQLVQV